MKWHVEAQYSSISALVYTNIEASGPGEALQIVIAVYHLLKEPWYSNGLESFPRYPIFVVRPQEHVDIEIRAAQKGRDARDGILLDWLERNVEKEAEDNE